MAAVRMGEASAGLMREAGIQNEEGDQRGRSAKRYPDRPTGCVLVSDREVLDDGEAEPEDEKERRDP